MGRHANKYQDNRSTLDQDVIGMLEERGYEVKAHQHQRINLEGVSFSDYLVNTWHITLPFIMPHKKS